MAVIGDRVSGGGTGEVPSDGGAQPGGSCWTPRLLLLGPALMQLVVAYVLSQELRSRASEAGVLVPVILLALGGAGGIVAGIFGRSRRVLHLGVLCAVLGFVLPIAINAAAAPVDKDTSTIPGLGDFDAEGLGLLTLVRVLVELPFWMLYALIVIVGYLGSRRLEKGTVARQVSSDPRPR